MESMPYTKKERRAHKTYYPLDIFISNVFDSLCDEKNIFKPSLVGGGRMHECILIIVCSVVYIIGKINNDNQQDALWFLEEMHIN